jgi:hypothetical protein
MAEDVKKITEYSDFVCDKQEEKNPAGFEILQDISYF